MEALHAHMGGGLAPADRRLVAAVHRRDRPHVRLVSLGARRAVVGDARADGASAAVSRHPLRRNV
jgi:hypothetical protein